MRFSLSQFIFLALFLSRAFVGRAFSKSRKTAVDTLTHSHTHTHSLCLSLTHTHTRAPHATLRRESFRDFSAPKCSVSVPFVKGGKQQCRLESNRVIVLVFAASYTLTHSPRAPRSGERGAVCESPLSNTVTRHTHTDTERGSEVHRLRRLYSISQ